MRFKEYNFLFLIFTYDKNSKNSKSPIKFIADSLNID